MCIYPWEGRREFISGWAPSTCEEEKESLWVKIGFDVHMGREGQNFKTLIHT